MPIKKHFGANDYDFTKKRVLVTGANGFVGKHLCKALFQKEAVVIGLLRRPVDNKCLSEQHVVDILDESTLRQVIHDVQPEFVVHLAANKNRAVNSDSYREGYETNLMGSFNLINSCRGVIGLNRFVFLGSTEEYGELQPPFKEVDKEAPVTAYGASKLAVTELLKSLGRANEFCGVILRPTIAYGPGQDDSMFLPALIKTLVANKDFKMSLGEQTRDFIYIDDLVQAIIEALVIPGLCSDVINISSAEPIRIDAVAKMTANLVNCRAEQLLKFGEKDYRPGDLMEYWASNNLAKRLLGWAPAVPLEDGLQRTIDYFKAKEAAVNG